MRPLLNFPAVSSSVLVSGFKEYSQKIIMKSFAFNSVTCMKVPGTTTLRSQMKQHIQLFKSVYEYTDSLACIQTYDVHNPALHR